MKEAALTAGPEPTPEKAGSAGEIGTCGRPRQERNICSCRAAIPIGHGGIMDLRRQLIAVGKTVNRRSVLILLLLLVLAGFCSLIKVIIVFLLLEHDQDASFLFSLLNLFFRSIL